ncbi:MAG: triose-phosphate isomerase [Patescibacteria group bacterium]
MSKTSKKIIIANWKMNPERVSDAAALAKKIERAAAASAGRGVEIVAAPPFPFLAAVGRVLKKARLGAQDVFWEGAGAYTGEVSPAQLKNMGVSYVIVGHSERRTHLSETDEMIAKKINAALEAGLAAILCVGEPERAGADIPPIVGEQLRSALGRIKKELLKNLVVAYEPVWAISTTPGRAGAATPDSAFRARIFIEKVLVSLFGARAQKDVRVIYGGSVTPDNTAAFLREGRMDGVLVGGASLHAKEFGAIVRSASV